MNVFKKIKSNISYTLITALLVIGGGGGCSITDNDQDIDHLNSNLDENLEKIPFISSDGSILSISNFESFRKLTESDSLKALLEKHNDLENRRSTNLRTTEEQEDLGDFLGSILNNENMLSIGDYTFKVLINEEIVYVIGKNSKLDQFLIDGNYSKKGIMRFSTNDDVLNLLENGFTSSPDSKNGFLCGGGCSSYDLSTPWMPFNPTGNSYSTRVRYVKAGIYFELSYHMYMNWLIGPPINNANSPFATHQVRYQKNCDSTIRQDSSNGKPQIMSLHSVEQFGISSGRYNFKRNLYARTEGLKKIFVNVNFTVNSPSINVNSNTINCRF